MALQIETLNAAAASPNQATQANLAEQHANPAQAIVKQTFPPTQPADTVKLSLAAHIRQLRNEGFDPSQIAVSLGVTAQTVSSYLGSLHTTSSPALPHPSLPDAIAVTTPVNSSAGAQTATAR